MATTQPCPHTHTTCTSSRRRDDDSDFSLKEWAARARISRDNTNNTSRRFSSSSSYFREDARSFRSNFTISSTASSPGYAFKDEIDPSTYSFTTALKALQARSSSGCYYQSWECSSSSPPEGFALNSKWNDAEKYICNPLSGKVPLECLSAKTLSGRSFRYSANNRITMSAPLVYSSTSTHNFQSKPSSTNYTPQHVTLQFPIPEKEKKKEGMTRDVGTQSTPPFLSSSSPSPASTPPIIERSIKRSGGESPISNSKTKSEEEEVEEKDKEGGGDTEETTETEKEKEKMNMEKKKKKEQVCRKRHAGCFSWMRRDHNGSLRQRKNNNIFPAHFKGC